MKHTLRGPKTPTGKVVILAIDDKALEKFGGFPLARSALGELVNELRSKSPAVVAFDLLLAGRREGDLTLAQALRDLPNAILAVSISNSARAVPPALETAMRRSSFSVVVGDLRQGPKGILGPLPEFAAATSIGHINVALDGEGSLRRVPAAITYGDKLLLPSLPVTAASRLLGLVRAQLVIETDLTLHFGEQRVPLDRESAQILNFRGARHTIPTISLADIGRADLKGKVVFVGATANGYGDRFSTPFDAALPGVEVLATAADNILAGDVIRRDSLTWVIDILLALTSAIAAVVLAYRRLLATALIATGTLWLAVAGLQYAAFVGHLWLDATTALLVLAIGSSTGFAARQIGQRRNLLNLAKYKSPKLVEVLAEQARPAFDGRAQKAAALFVDAAGFTSLSDKLGPQRTAVFLKQFHGRIERAANRTGGMVEQFAGDGALILFGLPDPSDDDAKNAILCAQLLLKEIAALHGDDSLQGALHDVRIRIGAHYGDVVAAVLGGAQHGHVTVTGSVVNAASRLQEVAKAESVDVVVSQALLVAAGADFQKAFRPLGAKPLRGLDQPLEVWTLM